MPIQNGAQPLFVAFPVEDPMAENGLGPLPTTARTVTHHGDTWAKSGQAITTPSFSWLGGPSNRWGLPRFSLLKKSTARQFATTRMIALTMQVSSQGK